MLASALHTATGQVDANDTCASISRVLVTDTCLALTNLSEGSRKHYGDSRFRAIRSMCRGDVHPITILNKWWEPKAGYGIHLIYV